MGNNNYKYIRGIYNFLDKNGDTVLYADGIVRVYDSGEKYLHGEAMVYFKVDNELCSRGFYRFDERTKKSYVVGELFHNYGIYKAGNTNIGIPIKRGETKYYNMMGEEISEIDWKKLLVNIRLGGGENEDFSCFNLRLDDFELIK